MCETASDNIAWRLWKNRNAGIRWRLCKKEWYLWIDCCKIIAAQAKTDQCCFGMDCILQYCSHRILYPYHSINHQFPKSEAFQSVHHVTYMLCYTVLYDLLQAVGFLLNSVEKEAHKK